MLHARMAALRRRQPSKITGRHAYCKGLLVTAASWKREGRDVPHNIGNKVIKHNGIRWDALSSHDQVEYHQAAVTMRDRACEAVRVKRAALRLQLAKVIADRNTYMSGEGQCLRVALCKYLPDAVSRFNDLCASMDLTLEELRQRRELAVLPVDGPPAVMRDLFEAMVIPNSVARASGGIWATVARNRDDFKKYVYNYGWADGSLF